MKILTLLFSMLIIGNPNSPTSTLNGQWTLVCIKNTKTGNQYYRPLNYIKHQLSFIFIDDNGIGTLTGMTTTNQVFGTYKLNENKITVEDFGGTKIAEHGWGHSFWSDISKSESFKIIGDTLSIYCNNNFTILKFINPTNIK